MDNRYTRSDLEYFLNNSKEALSQCECLADYKIGLFRESGFNVVIYDAEDHIMKRHNTKTIKNTCKFLCLLNNLLFSDVVNINTDEDFFRLFEIIKN
jgi:hypothetical protein